MPKRTLFKIKDFSSEEVDNDQNEIIQIEYTQNDNFEKKTNGSIQQVRNHHLTCREIVEQLDRYIIGQKEAKRALAIGLRGRWRRMEISDESLRAEVDPKNMIMIGPTGVGKTAAVRRIARITHCPFIKVEATKFTEVGYIGRDVESILRDLVDIAFKKLRKEAMHQLASQVKEAVEERILDCFAPIRKLQSSNTDVKPSEKSLARDLYHKRLEEGVLDEEEIDIELTNQSLGVEIMGSPGMEEMTSQLQNMIQNFSSGRVRTHRMKVKEAMKLVQQEEADKLMNEEELKRKAIEWVEEYGIVFIDEIDKVCRRGDTLGSDVSREGVQRDLLPIIEGTTVSTKYGMVRTDHIFFITAGAFQSGQRPSDLIPELQGRLPIRVELYPLTSKDFERILTERHASLITQYQALFKTEAVNLQFSEEAITRIAEIAYLVNEKVENIGARRLYTVMERLLESLSFEASDLENKEIMINVDYVNEKLASLLEDEDSSHYIL